MGAMNKRERVMAALSGGCVDRLPISLWGHTQSDPRTAEEVAAVTIEFQRRFDWDLVKMMPSGMYYPEALGCTLTPPQGPGGANRLLDSVIKRPEDWERLPVLDPREGWLAEHVRSVDLVRKALGPDVPIIQTLFSPLTVAHKMCLHVPFLESVREHRASLEAGLRAIAEGSVRLAEAMVAAGADGFFYATQEMPRGNLSDGEFLSLGKAYDLDILRTIQGFSRFTLLHVCGDNIRAEPVADYPVHAINWDSHHTYPSLTEARSIWGMTLVGGLDRAGALVSGTPEQVEEEVRLAARQAGRRKFILGAGCGLPLLRPDANLLAARHAVESLD